MRLFNKGLSLAFLSLFLLGLGGWRRRQRAVHQGAGRNAKGTIPGSRTAEAETPEEYAEITPGLQGVGMPGGPRPDRGAAGYPDAKK